MSLPEGGDRVKVAERHHGPLPAAGRALDAMALSATSTA